MNLNCLLLKDENSIICKYQTQRVHYDRNITIYWIDPNHLVSRTRQITIPANHSSIYDYRYISGRLLGEWEFRIKDRDKYASTTFTLK
jgi:hypothetical protein